MLFRRICLLSFLPVIFAFSIYANAQQKPAYTFSTYLEDLEATKRESSIFFAGAVSLGLFNWDWGSSKSFKWNPEGWFGRNTGSGGADKLGHAFISYTITNVLADRLMRLGRSPERAAISASLTSQAIMLLVEVFDGFSKDHGFSYEDAVMNLTGTIFSYYRIVNPKLRELIDFRAEYWPSGYKDFRPMSDYSGQKFLLAFKFSGINSFQDNYLRFLELQAGYYTRGFLKAERQEGQKPKRHSFIGIGFNFSEILFGYCAKEKSELKNALRLVFEHIQIPKTAIRVSNEF